MVMREVEKMTRVLDVNGLTGGYGAVQILYGIDLHIDEGEFVTIIGPNGCGKSVSYTHLPLPTTPYV